MDNERKIQSYQLQTEQSSEQNEPLAESAEEPSEIAVQLSEQPESTVETVETVNAEDSASSEQQPEPLEVEEVDEEHNEEADEEYDDEYDEEADDEYDEEADEGYDDEYDEEYDEIADEEYDEEESREVEPEKIPDKSEQPAKSQSRPAPQPKKQKKQPKKKKKKWIWLPIVSAIIVLLVVMIIVGLSEMNSFKSHAKTMKAELKSVIHCVKDDDFNGADEAMDRVDESRYALHDKINSPFWTLVGKLPFMTEDIQAVKDLLGVLDTSCDRVIRPFISQAKAHPLSDLKAEGGFNVNLINSYLDFAEIILPTVDELAERMNGIKFGPISKEAVGDYTDKINSLVETYEHFKDYIPLVRAFCGDGKDRFYIMLAQNSAEIRASGGFPGSMGTVRIQDGVLEIGDFMSVYDLLPMGQAFDSGITDEEIQLFGYMYAGEAHDACFNPHFARVGEITKASYDEYNEEYVDGIISLTPAVIQDILKFLDETITLEDGSVLDGNNATKIIQRDLYIQYQGQEWQAARNNSYVDSLFSETAKQAMDILVSNFKLEKLPEYVKLFEAGFANRTIMLWLANPKEERLVEKVGASGNLNYDKNDPKAGIYFSVCDPSKLGMFVEILPELSEPIVLPDGSREYTMTVTFNNYLNDYLYEYDINSFFVLGGYGGAIQSYIYFFAPKGGTVSDFEISPWMWQDITLDEYEGLELGYILNLFLYPDEPVTITYKITTPPGVEAPLTIDMTPTLQDYR